AHELGCGHLRAEDVATALGSNLEEDVFLQRVYVGEPGVREDRLQPEAGRLPARPETAAADGHREGSKARAAGGILEVGLPVPVVVDAVPADLDLLGNRRRARARVLLPAVGAAADECTARRAGGAGRGSVADLAALRVDPVVAAERAARLRGRGRVTRGRGRDRGRRRGRPAGLR